MQDIYATGGGGAAAGDGRFFSSGGGDRRLRPYNNHHIHNQALKCPRCDSLNTKFCYYNNYNLSQPRHFCKSCRRYWTKGGVLRNVPVGGGCRKAKRAAKSKTPAATTTEPSRSSSSESSTLTAAAAPAAAPPAASVAAAAGEEGSNVYDLADMKLFGANPSFVDHQPLDADGQIFATEMGSFTNLMTSSQGMMSFGDTFTAAYGRLQQGSNNQLANNHSNNNSVGPSMVGTTGMSSDDWGSGGGGVNGGDEGLFDLTAAVDPAYWGQPQWSHDANDDDQVHPSLNYLP